MKKSVLLTTLLLGSFLGGNVYADELKRSCVKENPLVSGESDPTLLGIYAQVCDKKNKDNKNAYLVQAAQQFQKLGRNLKALQLVNEMNANGLNYTSLTDVKFLAGIGIADQALNQIRNEDSRYLNDESYSAATKLNEAVKGAKPFSVIDKSSDGVKSGYTPPKPVKKPPTKPKPPRNTNTTPKPTTTPKPATNSNSSGGTRVSPFGSLTN